MKEYDNFVKFGEFVITGFGAVITNTGAVGFIPAENAISGDSIPRPALFKGGRGADVPPLLMKSKCAREVTFHILSAKRHETAFHAALVGGFA
ncbi:MAG: hypothetical protein CSA70_10975 [Rhodobacterales bacterium]|nr:MAG: hypothetical protein CSA70_10975 [Rhodobacterales bacterium]